LRALFACGGTGGHIYPAIAIAEELLKRDKKAEVLFTGSMNGMEKKIVGDHGFRFMGVDARPLVRKLGFENIVNAFFVIKSLFDAAAIVREFNPDITVGTGGFVSFPAVLAAAMMGKRSLIHEPNIMPGLANRMLAPFASVITAGFPDTLKYFPEAVVTGNPVRASILKVRKAEAARKFRLSAAGKTVLIMPGSRAAKSINRAMTDSLGLIEKELKGVQFIWMTGEADFDAAKAAVAGHKKVRAAVLKFIEDAGLAYSLADAGILRAGASTLTELAAVRLPAILVPYPHATDNHQEKNAKILEARGAAVVIKDGGLGPGILVKALKAVLDVKQAAKMKKELAKIYKGNSVERIVKILTGDAKC
jgi:UDP-N-acetylglucosamine--N-acetylmuramyl-(pentapeptide) pyrophosphoryl-undecaprenol N-acetylglucosamine transferase